MKTSKIETVCSVLVLIMLAACLGDAIGAWDFGLYPSAKETAKQSAEDWDIRWVDDGPMRGRYMRKGGCWHLWSSSSEWVRLPLGFEPR